MLDLSRFHGYIAAMKQAIWVVVLLVAGCGDAEPAPEPMCNGLGTGQVLARCDSRSGMVAVCPESLMHECSGVPESVTFDQPLCEPTDTYPTCASGEAPICEHLDVVVSRCGASVPECDEAGAPATCPAGTEPRCLPPEGLGDGPVTCGANEADRLVMCGAFLGPVCDTDEGRGGAHAVVCVPCV